MLIPDPNFSPSWIRITEFEYFNTKTVLSSRKIRISDPDPGTHPRSRIQGIQESKRHRIPDPLHRKNLDSIPDRYRFLSLERSPNELQYNILHQGTCFHRLLRERDMSSPMVECLSCSMSLPIVITLHIYNSIR
jgi:hypothetical protein